MAAETWSMALLVLDLLEAPAAAFRLFEQARRTAWPPSQSLGRALVNGPVTWNIPCNGPERVDRQRKRPQLHETQEGIFDGG